MVLAASAPAGDDSSVSSSWDCTDPEACYGVRMLLAQFYPVKIENEWTKMGIGWNYFLDCPLCSDYVDVYHCSSLAQHSTTSCSSNAYCNKLGTCLLTTIEDERGDCDDCMATGNVLTCGYGYSEAWYSCVQDHGSW